MIHFADYISSAGGGWEDFGNFFSRYPIMFASDAGSIQFLGPQVKKHGILSKFLFWQNYFGKILQFWIECIKSALIFLKMPKLAS